MQTSAPASTLSLSTHSSSSCLLQQRAGLKGYFANFITINSNRTPMCQSLPAILLAIFCAKSRKTGWIPGGQVVCRYDTINPMSAKTGLLVAFCFGCVPLGAQNSKPPQPADEPVAVFTVHPRLFLPAPRLRLLKRERERSSARWQQLELLVAGNAPMPERGFAHA